MKTKKELLADMDQAAQLVSNINTDIRAYGIEYQIRYGESLNRIEQELRRMRMRLNERMGE